MAMFLKCIRVAVLVVILSCDLSVISAAAIQTPGTSEFEFVASSDCGIRPVFRAVQNGLPENIDPAGLLALGERTGDRVVWSGWFTYGDENSRSISVALVQPKDGSPASLFLDADRNQTLESTEPIRPAGDEPDTWTCDLTAEFVTGLDANEYTDGRVLLRRTADGSSMEIANAGVLKGRAQIGDKNVAAIRIDRNANGKWFDKEDRLVLDLDQDGICHPIGERFGCATVLRFAGERYVVASDNSGRKLDFTPLIGTGKVALSLKLEKPAARLVKLNGILSSSGGVRATFESLEQPVECPPGDYRLESLHIELEQDGVTWEFRFSDLNPSKFPIPVAVNDSVNLELLGPMDLKITKSVVEGASGKSLQIVPLLKSQSGLYLTLSRNGRGLERNENRLTAVSHVDGKNVGTDSSGFS